jgi:hypothetical protein
MSRSLLATLVLSIVICGCNDNEQNTAYQSSQNPKPVVSIVPVIDNTKNAYAWNLSDELSSAIYNRIAKEGHVVVNRSSQVRAKANQIVEGQNPFGADIGWMKKIFQGDQFVAFLELIEHEEVQQQSKKSAQNWSADLNMSMRVRVLDLRGNEPKVVLQEIIRESHYIPRPFTQPSFFQVSWGTESFGISPIGLAHSDFTKEIALHLEDYILRAAK